MENYTKTTWVDGDVISSQKLNNIENGLDAVSQEAINLKVGLNGKLDEPSTAGTSGQVLTSDGQGGQSWQTPSGGGSVSSVNGQTGTVVLDADDVGAIASPSSPTSGQFLSWNGSAWVASDLPVYSGGVS